MGGKALDATKPTWLMMLGFDALGTCASNSQKLRNEETQKTRMYCPTTRHCQPDYSIFYAQTMAAHYSMAIRDSTATAIEEGGGGADKEGERGGERAFVHNTNKVLAQHAERGHNVHFKGRNWGFLEQLQYSWS